MRYINSRMFDVVTTTWNPITGCKHNCVYCWARRLVNSRLKGTKKYRRGFEPTIHEREFKREFKPNEFVFVSDMGDMWGSWVPEEWIVRVLEHVARFPKTTFLFLTKNPQRYGEFRDLLSGLDNVILGATIETDLQTEYMSWRISEAPAPDARFAGMYYMHYCGFRNLMISVEPVLEFSDYFPKRIKNVEPRFVYVGYDNYMCRLPEPPLSKTLWLIDELKRFTVVRTKTVRHAWYEVCRRRKR